MNLQGLNDWTHGNQLTQALAPELRHGKLFLHLIINALHFFIVGIGNFNQFSPQLLKIHKHIFTDKGFRSFLPVIAMNHIIRLQFLKDLIIYNLFLHQHLMYQPCRSHDFDPLFQGNRREAVKAYHSFIRKHSHINLS